LRLPGLYARSVAAVVLSVVACLLLMTLFGGTLSWILLRRMVDIVAPLETTDLERCDADPSAFLWENGRGLQAWAIDPETLAPYRHDVRPVPPSLVARVRLGEERPVAIGDGATWGGAMVTRHPAHDACQLMFVTWAPQPGIRDSFRFRLLILLVVVALLSLTTTGFLVLRPLFHSIRVLDGASRRVGTTGYTSPSDIDRSLVAVATALDDAHARILAEQAQLEAHNRALERHLADVAHDLRTPLAALQLRLEQLADETASDALRGALQDVTTLGLLTENLALSSQMEAGALPARAAAASTVDLSGVVERVAARFAALGSRVGVEVVHIRPDQPVQVEGAMVHVEQLLANLVNNAVRYNQHGGHVAIVLTADADRFTLVVEDDGPGIPASDRRAMLERGVRGRSEHPDGAAAGETPGEGLGLSIVVRLAPHLGWTFAFEDPKEGPGLRAVLSGPVAS
jgi:signal transduction histidine kinase